MGREPRAGPGITLVGSHCRHFPELGKASQNSGLGLSPYPTSACRVPGPDPTGYFFPHFLHLILLVNEENICLNAEYQLNLIKMGMTLHVPVSQQPGRSAEM